MAYRIIYILWMIFATINYKISFSQTLLVNSQQIEFKIKTFKQDRIFIDVSIKNNYSSRIWINGKPKIRYYFDNSLKHDSLSHIAILNISDECIPDDYKTRYDNYIYVKSIEPDSSYNYELIIPLLNRESSIDSIKFIEVFFSYVVAPKIKVRHRYSFNSYWDILVRKNKRKNRFLVRFNTFRKYSQYFRLDALIELH